jgi:hypothetical protein
MFATKKLMLLSGLFFTGSAFCMEIKIQSDDEENGDIGSKTGSTLSSASRLAIPCFDLVTRPDIITPEADETTRKAIETSREWYRKEREQASRSLTRSDSSSGNLDSPGTGALSALELARSLSRIRSVEYGVDVDDQHDDSDDDESEASREHSQELAKKVEACAAALIRQAIIAEQKQNQHEAELREQDTRFKISLFIGAGGVVAGLIGGFLGISSMLACG